MKKRILSLLMAGLLTVSCLPITVLAENNMYDGIKPADGTTEEQPFIPGETAGSECQLFRIPALACTADGTLVAGCDARWNSCGDGGGLDTIVTTSTDEGATWNWTLANYLGDNGNQRNGKSSAFIDASFAVDGNTVWMACDLYPSGVSLSTANTTYVAKEGNTGFDADHNLLLAQITDSVNGASDSSERAKAAYEYHLEKIDDAEDTDDSYYQIVKNADNTVVTGYEIDAYFNIKSTDGVDTNLFCGDSPYYPYPTDFVYITKSTDSGKTWSVPVLADVKKESEQTILVAPGHGVVTSEGRIIFTCYEYTYGDKNSSVIYSDDNGVTWHRGGSVSGTSSEAVAVEAEGRLYMFVRRQNVYYTSEDGGITWSEPQNMGITYNANCQLTAITYSKKIDGKTAILFAGPSDTSGRNSGRIWVGLIQEDGSITWQKNPYVVNEGSHYAYSCLAEMPDGTVALVYENQGEKIRFEKIAIEDIAKDAVVGDVWITDDTDAVVNSVSMKFGTTATYTVNQLDPDAEVKAVSAKSSLLEVSYAEGQLTLKARAGKTGYKKVLVTITAGDASTVLEVNITNTENYEVISLKEGDSETMVFKGSYYGDADLSEVDPEVASVSLKARQEQEEIDRGYAQLSSGVAAYEGNKVDLKRCMYTLEAGGSTNTYKVKALNTSGTAIYLGHKASSSAGLPNVTGSTPNITFELNEEEETFALKDNSTGGGGQYLYFHDNNTSKLYFDRQGSADEHCYFELYTPSPESDDLITGYKRVSSYEELKAGSSYLIVTKADENGNKYLLIPSTGTEKQHHVAKLVWETVSTKEEGVAPATATAVFDETNQEALRDCLYIFTKVADEEDTYVISGYPTDGNVTFIDLTTAGVPNKNAAAQIQLKAGTTDSSKVAFYSADQNRHLYFWRDTTKLYFDRNTGMEAACEFELFEPSEDAADSPISGYKKLENKDAVVSGGEYLIAAQVNGEYYVLHPELSNSKYTQVAKVTGEKYLNPAAAAYTEVTVIGAEAGCTELHLGDKVYYIWVEGEEQTVENPFVDLKENAYYYDAVLWAVDKGITTGKTETTFCPKDDCTRAQVVMFLWNAAGRPEPNETENPFTDVSTGSRFYDAILWAYENGITKGYKDHTFRPNDTVRRAEYVTFQYRAAGEPEVETTVNPFTDVTREEFPHFMDAILWAVENGITEGKTPTTFQPNSNCSRGNVVTFLYREAVK